VHKNTSAEGTPKSDGSFRAVPMGLDVARELELHFQASAFQGDDHLVFGNPITGRRLDRTGVTTRFQRALKRARLPELTFHELRHTFGTMCAAKGTPVRTIQEWMGHADIKTTQIYMHHAPRSDEARLIDAAFAGLDLSSPIPSPKLSETEDNSDPENPVNTEDDG
jgi:integrase